METEFDSNITESNMKKAAGNNAPKRTLMNRWFGPLRNGNIFYILLLGSFRSSLLTLVASMIGVGFLTLPNIGKYNGWVAIIFFVLLSAVISALANL